MEAANFSPASVNIVRCAAKTAGHQPHISHAEKLTPLIHRKSAVIIRCVNNDQRPCLEGSLLSEKLVQLYESVDYTVHKQQVAS